MNELDTQLTISQDIRSILGEVLYALYYTDAAAYADYEWRHTRDDEREDCLTEYRHTLDKYETLIYGCTEYAPYINSGNLQGVYMEENIFDEMETEEDLHANLAAAYDKLLAEYLQSYKSKEWYESHGLKELKPAQHSNLPSSMAEDVLKKQTNYLYRHMRVLVQELITDKKEDAWAEMQLFLNNNTHILSNMERIIFEYTGLNCSYPNFVEVCKNAFEEDCAAMLDETVCMARWKEEFEKYLASFVPYLPFD
jgi:hypothetical protein